MTDREKFSAYFDVMSEYGMVPEYEEAEESIVVADRRFFFSATGEIVKVIGYVNGKRAWMANEKGRTEYNAQGGKI